MSLRLALAIALFSSSVEGLTVDEQTMVISSAEASPCVRLYNNDKDGWVGCSTSREGVTLDIMGFDDANPSQSVSDLKSASGAKAVLIPQNVFTTEWLNKLEATGNLGGVMVYSKTPPAEFSPANTANGFNKDGNSFNYKQFTYPIVMLSGDKTTKVLEFAKKNKKAVDSPLLLPTYKAKFSFYMGPSGKVTSNQCLLWKDLFGDIRPQCQAIGGLSVWATTEPIDKPAAAAKKVVMATSGIDGASLFHDLVPGADAPASSVVAILAAADAINTWRAKGNSFKNVIGYSLFQGEAWDSIGSRRFVYDIARYQGAASCNNTVQATESPTGRALCLDPLLPSLAFQSFGASLDKLDAVVAVDQVARGDGNVYFHTDTATVPPSVGKKADTSTMPPSPVDSFRLRKPTMAGYVLSGYNEAFSNTYYHSQYDNFTATSLDGTAPTDPVPKIQKAAVALAQTLIWLADEKAKPPPAAGDIVVNATLVKELMACITGNWQCKLFRTYLDSTYKNLNNYLGAQDLQFDPMTPSTDSRKPSLYASVASIDKIPPTLPYITLTVDDINNFVFSLPKCAKGQVNKPNKELCMLCDSADCNLKSKKALMQNIHVVTYPKNVYEGFLRSFLVARTTANATSVGCNATADCTGNKHVGTDFECHMGKCILPSAYYHTAISPALDPTPNGEIYNLNEDLCTGPYKWICPNGKEMLWTEPNWSADIGVTIYPDGGNAVAWIAFFVGIVVFGVGFYAARLSLAGLQKQKLL